MSDLLICGDCGAHLYTVHEIGRGRCDRCEVRSWPDERRLALAALLDLSYRDRPVPAGELAAAEARARLWVGAKALEAKP